jgi:hypothetical protein
MKNPEGPFSADFFGGGGLNGVHPEMQLFHFGKKDIATNEAEGKQTHQEEQSESLKGFPGVEPFANQVSESNGRAPDLEIEITFQHDLSRRARIGKGEQTRHLIRKKRGAHRGREKNQRPEPDRRVDYSNNAKKTNHENGL